MSVGSRSPCYWERTIGTIVSEPGHYPLAKEYLKIFKRNLESGDDTYRAELLLIVDGMRSLLIYEINGERTVLVFELPLIVILQHSAILSMIEESKKAR